MEEIVSDLDLEVIAMTFASAFDSCFTLEVYGEFCFRIIIAALCGACLGFERSRKMKDAGLRTHIIVCSASALMMLVSKYGFVDLEVAGEFLSGTRGADPARIAAQIIGGVGFLGAGIIFHMQGTVKGLTTAAGVWATAGIGIAIGAGMYVLGLFLTIIIFLVQVVIPRIGRVDKLMIGKISFVIKPNENFRKQLGDFLDNCKADVMESSLEIDEQGFSNYNLTLRVKHEIDMDDFHVFLEKHGQLKSVSIGYVATN